MKNYTTAMELAKKYNLSEGTVRTFLGRPEFARFEINVSKSKRFFPGVRAKYLYEDTPEFRTFVRLQIKKIASKIRVGSY